MHSCESPLPPPPATGPALLVQLGRLIIRARSRSPTRAQRPPADVHERLLQAKLLATKTLVANCQPSTSKQVLNQPKPDNDEPKTIIEAQLSDHVHALWNEQIPICIDVLLAPNCNECYKNVTKVEEEAAYEKPTNHDKRCLLLERWTMSVFLKKNHETPTYITSQWLLNAVRSQLHFSQLSAWLSRLKDTIPNKAEEAHDPNERRRKLSREKCNIKKLEANCDEKDLPTLVPNAEEETGTQRKLNIVYSIKIPGESYKMAEFSRPPTDHTFPTTDIGNNVYLKVLLQSLPRRENIPTVKCCCQLPKRRASKEMPPLAQHEELALRMNDLNLGPKENRPIDYRCKGSSFSPDLGVINSNIGPSSGVSRRLSIFGSSEYLYSRASTPERQLDNEPDDVESNGKENCRTDRYKCEEIKPNFLLDDRMLTPCSESGKHKCNCDDESDHGNNRRSSTSYKFETKKQLDERRLKEIAKYKRRLRKESKLRKLRESGTSESANSEGDGLLDGPYFVRRDKCKEETHTSIPILQASRFDRFRAIGCYRNQTYLTLPANRIEIKSPFVEPVAVTPIDYRKTISVGTQTDEPTCTCGQIMNYKCDNCFRGMVRSEANYNLASLNQSEILLNAIRKGHEFNDDNGADDSEKAKKKHKCDIISNSLTCDNFSNNNVDDSSSNRDAKVTSGVRKCPDDGVEDRSFIKRPKLRRFFPIVDRMEKIVSERVQQSVDSDIDELLLKDDDSVFAYMSKSHESAEPRKKNSSIGEEEYVSYEKCDYGTFDKCETPPSPLVASEGFKFPDVKALDNQVPSPTEMDKFRWRFDSAASMVFHTRTGLPLTSSPAPLKRGSNRFDYDDSINGISGIKSALFHPISTSPAEGWVSPLSPASPASPCPSPSPVPVKAKPKSPEKPGKALGRPRRGPSAGLLGTFEESALKGRLEPVATVHGFTAELGASGSFCPPHRRLPVTVFFYAPGGTNAPYMGHIDLGGGYRVARAGTVQVSLFNPHGTLVKMFVVLYDLSAMPPLARTFLRQRTLYMPAHCERPSAAQLPHWLRYLIHLRFLTSKSGKLYLHTDIRIIVSKKSDLDTATAHSAIFKTIPQATNGNCLNSSTEENDEKSTNRMTRSNSSTNQSGGKPTNRTQVNRIFGGSSDANYNYDSAKSDYEFLNNRKMNRSDGCFELANKCKKDGGGIDYGSNDLGVDMRNGVSYELRSFTYGPENPKYSPR